jgi:transcriptional regulator with PAS, ATPase and Fis domain
VDYLEFAQRVAKSTINIVLEGETGVGKGVLAKQIHKWSDRADRPFVTLNCAGIPETLLESELFGHKKGAFTGATRDRTGIIASAHKGTLFLDEIAELTLSSQGRLLRVVQDRVIVPIGSVNPIPIDVRIISATNRVLKHEVEKKQFRLDLFYRLNGVLILVPPLRYRMSEIQSLSTKFVIEYATRTKIRTPGISKEVLKLFQTYSWPGNIRELRNIMELAVVLCEGNNLILIDHIQGLEDRKTEISTFDKTMIEKNKISEVMKALDIFGGNQTQAARYLGISRGTLIKVMDKHNVKRPRK